MKSLLVIFLSVIALSSCSNRTEQNQNIAIEQKTSQIADTLIGTKKITNEIAGSAYRKRATAYFVVIKGDTSGFRPIFTESRDGGDVDISQNLPYTNETETYFQRLIELKLILAPAAKEFNFDSLKSMSMGRLILSGDLAIAVTEEYRLEFGETGKITTADYRKIADFLLESKLTKDLNELFKPYSKTVEKVSIEKVFFSTKEVLMNNSSISKDTTDIPDKIFDCITGVIFKNK